MFPIYCHKQAVHTKGFTIVETMIAVAILGILTSLAVPAYLSQRDKARVRSIEASTKSNVADTQGWMDSFVAGDPIIALNSSGGEICIQSSSAAASKTCSSIYNQSSSTSYDPSDLASLVSLIVAHHAGRGERSPYNVSQSLFVSATGTQGTVVVVNVSQRTLRLEAYTKDTSTAAITFNVIGRLKP